MNALKLLDMNFKKLMSENKSTGKQTLTNIFIPHGF
jgi:hypothetical protein